MAEHMWRKDRKNEVKHVGQHATRLIGRRGVGKPVDAASHTRAWPAPPLGYEMVEDEIAAHKTSHADV
ncbi:uncharacterized protein ColSpa_03693 [Colletotrichum spaethianum]|uniref:Uncharacterized protein n=1 Tax=Colletotrichum spaethianum TaxID=700344 RepID=A0AA37LG45_9PEZI|nr:uncharacterized protein ColSpa_03693 [Colletotrichum spaethianum]GKT43512.1 hypothetical protein ColSpa_03693 [Colletotrichum spaethianum]